MAFSQPEVCEQVATALFPSSQQTSIDNKDANRAKDVERSSAGSGDRVSPQSISRLQGYSSLQHTGSLVPEDQHSLASAWQMLARSWPIDPSMTSD
jgi:hypothetical protein